MTPETRIALEQSIAKWKRNTELKSCGNTPIHAESCPLCNIFCTEWHSFDNACDGCPVREATGYRLCHGTPWPDCARAIVDGDDERFREASTKMHRFPGALLPAK